MQHITKILDTLEKTAECRHNLMAYDYATPEKKDQRAQQYHQARQNLDEARTYYNWLFCRMQNYNPYIEGKMHADDYISAIRLQIKTWETLQKMLKTLASKNHTKL